MLEVKWISYLRVSTDRQGQSGLGIEAQRNSVAEYLDGGNWSLVKEYTEVESGKLTSRPMLADAIKACRAYDRCKASPYEAKMLVSEDRRKAVFYFVLL